MTPGPPWTCGQSSRPALLAMVPRFIYPEPQDLLLAVRRHVVEAIGVVAVPATTSASQASENFSSKGAVAKTGSGQMPR